MCRIWDTSIAGESTLLAAILCEHHRQYMNFMKSNDWKPNPETKNEKMAGTGELFLDHFNTHPTHGVDIPESGTVNNDHNSNKGDGR